jgi:sulfate adenylyltransferase
LLMSENLLIPPCGGELVDVRVAAEESEELTARARRLPSVQLSERQACDLELLATGAFSPLDKFMGEADHERVVEELRLACGHVFPVPVTLSVKAGDGVRLDGEVALRDARSELLALMSVEEVYGWDKASVAARVFGTRDARHPLVAEMAGWGESNVSGRLRVLSLPRHADFRRLRLTPAEARARLSAPRARGDAGARARRRGRDAAPAPGRRPDEAGRR